VDHVRKKHLEIMGEELTGGKDDQVFRLDRIDVAACSGMKE